MNRDSSGAPLYDSWGSDGRRQQARHKHGGEGQPSNGGGRGQGERRAHGAGSSGERKSSPQKNSGFYGRVADSGERKPAAPKSQYRQGGEGRPKRRRPDGGEAA